MDILYVLGHGSKWNNNELRYSLRSIEKYGIGIDRVFLSGTIPDFVSKKITYISSPEYTKSAGHNMLKHIKDAVEQSDIADKFIVASDDHFYIKETDFNSMPMYKKGELPSDVSSGILGDEKYTTSLVHTKALLIAAGLTTINFSQHTGGLFDKSIFMQCENIWKAAELLPYGVEATCIVQNAMLQSGRYSYIQRKDCKIKSCTGKEDLLQQVGERQCFSIYDSAIKFGVAEYLENEFNKKSIYEK